ncbi:Rap family tetratricopeptide repeat protein [Bacillus sp. FSL M8-0077]|uniref:Rap family tetratricopeptide repeat protein n=1 Tax=Bacillus sp. FSL M8-0077 TaxID=2954556 RepID=UPI0030FD7701
MAAVSSAKIGQKINEWYQNIKRLNVTDAEMLRSEIRRDLDIMEEDEQAVLYFQLMEFRHEQMLEYMNLGARKLNKAEYLRSVEGQGRKLTGILEYYFNFFKGMYEFSQGNYITAITFYRQAEKRLDRVADEVERAEFYFKMAEIFYHMKQTQMSMYYIMLALDTYKAHPTYLVREIQSRFVVSGNYIDLNSSEKSLPHLDKALEKSHAIKDELMIGISLMNLGHCYSSLEKYQLALDHLEEAEIYLKRHSHIRAILYQQALIHFKLGNDELAKEYLQRGIDYLKSNPDQLFESLYDFLVNLYIKPLNLDDLKDILKRFDNIRGYPYLEELALESAEFYTKCERMEESVYLYQQMVYAQKQIRRGDCLYEH